jgi:hypothetical protein
MKRHSIDIVGLVSGMLFMALAVGFLLDALDVWRADVGWVPPIVLVALGLAGVLSTATRASRTREPLDVSAAEPVDEPVQEHTDEPVDGHPEAPAVV